MLIGEILSNIRTTVVNRAGTDVRPRQVYYSLLRARATVIENKIRDDKKLSRTNVQVIPCAKLVKAAPAECGCLTLSSECFLYRTVCKLPKSLTYGQAYDIENVSSIDGSLTFIKTSWQSFTNIPFKKYTSKMPHYMVYNDYVFVINNYIDNIPVEYITFDGVFEDPVKALECNVCTGPNEIITPNVPNIVLPICSSVYDMEFPLSGKLLDTATKIVLAELIANFNKDITDAYQRQTDLLSDEV